MTLVASARAGAWLFSVVSVVACAACGGSAFTSSSSGNRDGGESQSQDGSTSGANDAGSDAATPQEASVADGGGPMDPAIACGANSTAPSCTKTCCVDKVNGSFEFKCEDALTCGASQGTGLRCNDSRDCRSTDVCCISQVQGGAFYARCAPSCGSGEGQLCTAPLDPKCPATEPCSNNNIGSWNLPGSYATCGGVSP